jgi:hypothetical protein
MDAGEVPLGLSERDATRGQRSPARTPGLNPPGESGWGGEGPAGLAERNATRGQSSQDSDFVTSV